MQPLISFEYIKKKEKKDTIKFIKDETIPRGDLYKSHAVHVQSGEPPNSVSRPVPKRKEGVVRPITQGKLLKKGGPDVSGPCITRKAHTTNSCTRRSRGPLLDARNLPLDHCPESRRRLLSSHRPLLLHLLLLPQRNLADRLQELRLHRHLPRHLPPLHRNPTLSDTRRNMHLRVNRVRCV